MAFTPDDAADTQALLKTGFDDLYCCYLLLRIADVSRARAWLRSQNSDVTRFSQIGGGKRLTQHLPSEYLRCAYIAAGAAKQVHLQRFQLQQLQQFR